MTCAWPCPMTPAMTSPSFRSCQQSFHQRWHHLRDPHVRALAWLLDAPDMLDPVAPQWKGRIATLGPDAGFKVAPWLNALNQAPQPLHAYLQPSHQRLGRYAEELMGFYFRHQGTLRAHGLQVRTPQGLTIGEFDFLLELDGQFTHWELATKFYLLPDAPKVPTLQASVPLAPEAFVGPNLADTLGKKIGKTLNTQLALSRQPDAARVLPRPVEQVGALLKGWLFYPSGQPTPAMPGLAGNHCHGYWYALSAFQDRTCFRYAILPRLRWLAPANCAVEETQTWSVMQATLRQSFEASPAPVMVALLEDSAGRWLETERVFVVPDDWRSRAIGQSRSDA